MTSELSNALNPNVVQSRSRPRNPYSSPPFNFEYAAPQQAQPVVPYVPHRSELELAIAEPLHYQPPQAPPPPNQDSSTIQEIFRLLQASREDAEKERERRAAWEKEQEEKYASTQNDMQQQLLDMKEELARLKSSMNTSNTTPVNDDPPIPNIQLQVQSPPLPMLVIPTIAEPPQSTTPLTPVSQHALPSQPTFLEGSSSYPYGPQTPSTPHSSAFLTPQWSIPSVSNSPSPLLMAAPSPAASVSSYSAGEPSTSRKRNTPPTSVNDGSDEESEEAEDPDPEGLLPRKRLNGHDKRCLTIQHAIRIHFYKMMKVKSDKDLPESHVEGVTLPESSPIRFIWEKTAKQSPHNAAMKKRFLADLKAKQKRLYKYVPDKDFNSKTLDAAFDQAFTTLRQKYKAQKDETLARNYRIREDQKALKNRRNVRKRNKLSSRTEARTRLDVYSHETFNGALQPECMSSEESCDEYPELQHPSGSDSVQVLRIRGLPWRSSRLLRFYQILDEDEKVDRTLKAKRVVVRAKERCLGPPKDGFHLPPKGVSTWMVSRRWIRETRDAHPDLGELLKNLVIDPSGFDWGHFDILGMDSEEELESREHQEIPRSEISYSLAHALAPV